MWRLVNRTLLVVGMLSLASIGQAATYKVDGVWNGTSGGFRSSLFHDLSGGPMNGDVIGNISAEASGSYNSNGMLDLMISIIDPADPMNPIMAELTSDNLLFGADGWLSGPAQIEVSTDSLFAGTSNFVLNFGPGQQCCSGVNAPNSLENGLITLWGSTNHGPGGFFGTQTGYANIGLDLRVELSPVPIPAALPLFGTGLAVIAWFRRRKAQVEVAA